ncbi:MAG: exodeoxyribonuclease large subunit [Bacteroidota bacterium]
MNTKPLPLSSITQKISDLIYSTFTDQPIWITARIANVKKYPTNQRCYLTLEEYFQQTKITEARAVIWSNAYQQIQAFETNTHQPFKDGIEIVCKVRVRYHILYGINLDIIEIKSESTIDAILLQRQQTIAQLLLEHPKIIQLVNGVITTTNQQHPLPPIIQRIALITAPNSDGQRDFINELVHNQHQYTFNVDQYLVTIQGDNATQNIIKSLDRIIASKHAYQAVAIARGGGATADFIPFDHPQLAAIVAAYPIPILTGIGHDRNQSICDLMARQFKTPTKVAAAIVDHNLKFENHLIQLFQQVSSAAQNHVQQSKSKLLAASKIIKLANPETILKRGFALVRQNGQIITQPDFIISNDPMEVQLQKSIIHTSINNIQNISK